MQIRKFATLNFSMTNIHNQSAILNQNNHEVFIDTANLAQIKEAHDLGILDGVTTNPSLMAKEGIKGRRCSNETLSGYL